MSDRFPHAQPFDPAELGAATGLGSAAVQLPAQQRQDHDGRLRRDDALLRGRPGRPDHPGLPGVFPTPVRAARRRCRPTCAPTSATRRSCSTSRPGCSGATTSPTRSGSSRTTTCGRSRPAQANEQSLPSEAYYVIMRMPGESAAEFLLLQPMIPINRPNMIAWVAARNDGETYGTTAGLPLPGRDDDLRPGPDRGPHRPGPDHQRAVHAVAQLRQRRHPRQPHRRARSAIRCCTCSPSTCSRPAPRSPSSGASSWPRRARSCGARPSPRRCACCWRAKARITGRPTPESDPGPGSPARRPGRPADADRPTRTTRCRPTWPGSSTTRTCHFELAQAALRDGDFARYGEEIARVEARPGRARDACARAWHPVPRSVGQPGAMTLGAALGPPCSSTLARPSTWVLGLLAFLLRGGVVLVLAPDRGRALGGRPGQPRRPRR